MASKFDFRQSQQMIERETDVNGQVKILIAKLNALHDDYYKRAYLILNRILKLRQNQIRGYGYSHLAREKGITLNAHQISYIFGYKFISPKVMAKIDKGELKVGTALYLIRQSTKFKEHKNQEKAVDMYLKKEITTSQIGRLSTENLIEGIIDKKELLKTDKHAIRILMNMKNHLRDLRIRENSYRDRNVVNQIRLTSEHITEQCEHILKFGKLIDKPRVGARKSDMPHSYDFLNEPLPEKEEK